VVSRLNSESYRLVPNRASLVDWLPLTTNRSFPGGSENDLLTTFWLLVKRNVTHSYVTLVNVFIYVPVLFFFFSFNL